MFKIRRAKLEDARSIHDAHMRSINEVCASSYTEEEIKTWGGRAYDEALRHHTILNDFVWVVEINSEVHGYAHLKYKTKEDKTQIYLNALYFDAKLAGKGAGKKMMEILFDFCHANKVEKFLLNSSLNAKPFYEKFGFVQSGDLITELVNGYPIRCYPMSKSLS